MEEYEKVINRRLKAGDILIEDISADEKLFKIFQLYKEDLKKNYTQFYYAMLEWKDAHLNELREKIDLSLIDNKEEGK